jgi:hypothetical protein
MTSDDEESDDDPTDGGGYVPLHEEEESASDEDSDSDDSETDDDDDEDDDEDVISEMQSDKLRQQIMKDQWLFYTTFNDITHAKVVECLRFIHNAKSFGEEYLPPHVDEGDLDFIYNKLLEKYDATKLSEIGGVPRAFMCQQYVCKLFACLLLEIIPKVIKSKINIIRTLPSSITDPLSQVVNADPTKEAVWAEIEAHMNALDDPVAYIRRCVGGGVAYLITHRDDVPENYLDLFLPQRRRNPSEGPQPRDGGPRVLGASLRTPMNGDQNKSRIRIQVYPYPTTGDPYYINMLMDTHVEYDTLLERAVEKYEDVRSEMQGRQFTLLWSPYVYLGHHWNPRDNTPFVRIQKGFTTHGKRVWDTRGICCAVESTEGLQIHSPDTSITLGESQIDVSNENEAVEAFMKHIVENATDDWWDRKRGLMLRLDFGVQKYYQVYKGNTKRSLEKTMQSLRRKITLAVRCINRRYRKGFKADFTKTKPQMFLHAFKTLKLKLDFDYTC